MPQISGQAEPRARRRPAGSREVVTGRGWFAAFVLFSG